MDEFINIEEAVQLVNKKGTTFEQVCDFIHRDVEQYQNSRETFYLEELKDEFNGEMHEISEDLSDEITNKIYNNIQKDTKKFYVTYSTNSIDLVLDAMNQKKFKYKKGPQNLLILLSSLRELSEQV